MTVQQLMEKTGQKRGTIEFYRSLLQKYGLLTNNQALGQREVNTFLKAIEHKTDDKTWSDVMELSIQQEYGEEMHTNFYWSSESIVRHLIWLIKNNKVTYVGVNNIQTNPDDFHAVYESIIDNFSYIGNYVTSYKGSFNTDGNGVLSSAWKGSNYIYYIVGKYNPITKNEDMHIFYNEGIDFNIMRCQYICGGSCKKGFIAELYETIKLIKAKLL